MSTATLKAKAFNSSMIEFGSYSYRYSYYRLRRGSS